jgi:hypothetical protein
MLMIFTLIIIYIMQHTLYLLIQDSCLHSNASAHSCELYDDWIGYYLIPECLNHREMLKCIVPHYQCAQITRLLGLLIN